MELSAEGLADDAVPAHVAVYPAGGGDAVVEADVLLGAADLGELGPGDYEAVVEEAPVNPDGSTYALPEESTAFAVGGSGEAVELEIGLEPVAVEDMTAEQLEQAAAELEAAGKRRRRGRGPRGGADRPVRAWLRPTGSSQGGGQQGGSSSGGDQQGGSGGASTGGSAPEC